MRYCFYDTSSYTQGVHRASSKSSYRALHLLEFPLSAFSSHVLFGMLSHDGMGSGRRSKSFVYLYLRDESV